MFARQLSYAIALLFFASGICRADVVRLKSGGELRGSVTVADDKQLTLQLLSGSKVTLATDDVHFHVRRSDVEEEYETRLATLPSSADAHWELAKWCKANRLSQQHKWQLRAVLLRAPNHEDARRLLGYTRDGVTWRTHDQTMRGRGYVRSQKRYVTRQERDAIARTAGEKEAEAKWSRSMSRIANGIRNGVPEALEELERVRNPMAISGLTAFFREIQNPSARAAYVRALSQIDHPATIAPLVEQAVLDASPDVRALAAGAIRPDQYKAAIRLLVAYLESADNQVVQNAAMVLEQMETTNSVKPLIKALITLHEYSTRPSTVQEARDRVVDLLNDEDLTPSEVLLVLRAGVTPLRGVDSTTDESNGRIQATYPHRNAAVLSALKKITGEDFGYDQRVWRLWLRSER